MDCAGFGPGTRVAHMVPSLTIRHLSKSNHTMDKLSFLSHDHKGGGGGLEEGGGSESSCILLDQVEAAGPDQDSAECPGQD